MKSIDSVPIEVNGEIFIKAYYFQRNFCEYPQIIYQSSQIYFLFGQCSSDAQLLHLNSIHIFESQYYAGVMDMLNFSGPCDFWRSIGILTSAHILVQTRLNQFEESIRILTWVSNHCNSHWQWLNSALESVNSV